MAADELPRYVDDVLALKARYAGRIEVLLGLEADYIAGPRGDCCARPGGLPVRRRAGLRPLARRLVRRCAVVAARAIGQGQAEVDGSGSVYAEVADRGRRLWAVRRALAPRPAEEVRLPALAPVRRSAGRGRRRGRRVWVRRRAVVGGAAQAGAARTTPPRICCASWPRPGCLSCCRPTPTRRPRSASASPSSAATLGRPG